MSSVIDIGSPSYFAASLARSGFLPYGTLMRSSTERVPFPNCQSARVCSILGCMGCLHKTVVLDAARWKTILRLILALAATSALPIQVRGQTRCLGVVFVGSGGSEPQMRS